MTSKPPSCVFTGHGGASLGIHVYGEIDDDNAAAFAEALRWAEARLPDGCVLPVYVSSMGGDVYCAQQMCDLMAASHLTIDTVAVGQCMSAAALIFSHGRRRFVGPRATIMLHDVRLSGLFDGHLVDCEIETREARRLNASMWLTMSRNCGQPESFFQDRVRDQKGDLYVTPQVALEIQLATHVGVPRLFTEVHLELVSE